MAAESIINRKALRDYHIVDRYEAGIELKGSEVKSIRAGKANISDAFARIENGEAFLTMPTFSPTSVPATKSQPQNAFANCCSTARRSTGSTAKRK